MKNLRIIFLSKLASINYGKFSNEKCKKFYWGDVTKPLKRFERKAVKRDEDRINFITKDQRWKATENGTNSPNNTNNYIITIYREVSTYCSIITLLKTRQIWEIYLKFEDAKYIPQPCKKWTDICCIVTHEFRITCFCFTACRTQCKLLLVKNNLHRVLKLSVDWNSFNR